MGHPVQKKACMGHPVKSAKTNNKSKVNRPTSANGRQKWGTDPTQARRGLVWATRSSRSRCLVATAFAILRR